MSNRRAMMFGLKNILGTNFLTNLVAYYSFDGSNATDIHTGTHNGTIVGSPTFPSGKNSNCIDLGNNANLNYFTIADSDVFSFTNGITDVPFTISMWVWVDSVSSSGNWLINKRLATSGGDEWQLIFSGNSIGFFKFQFNNNGIHQQIATSENPFTLGSWNQVLYTDNGTGLVGSGKIYINGVLNSPFNFNSGGIYTRMNNGNAPVVLGINGWSPTQFLKHRGKLDEIAIWKNRELTSTEVTELYNAGAGKFYNTF